MANGALALNLAKHGQESLTLHFFAPTTMATTGVCILVGFMLVLLIIDYLFCYFLAWKIAMLTKVKFITGSRKTKPKAGDRRETKTHGLQIRVQGMARKPNGEPIGRLVSNGKPVLYWRRPGELDPWDYHHLSAEERIKFALM